jgi:hypothetical protein
VAVDAEGDGDEGARADERDPAAFLELDQAEGDEDEEAEGEPDAVDGEFPAPVRLVGAA